MDTYYDYEVEAAYMPSDEDYKDYNTMKDKSEKFSKGDPVWTWFDTGAFGVTQLAGDIVQCGPKTFTIEWESGIRNRIRHDETRCIYKGKICD